MRLPLCAAAVALCGCAPGVVDVTGPAAPASSGVPVVLEVASVPLDPTNPALVTISGFTYAGGLDIRWPEGDLHELSDLRVLSGNRLVAVSDRGEIFRARLVLEDGRLTGLTDGLLEPLVDQEGVPLEGQDQTDAEGLAIFPNGDWLVSFERNHRIWLYPADGALPRTAPMPDAMLPDNAGIEALTAYPSAGPDAYLAGSERGRVWVCELRAGCRDTALGSLLPPGLGLTSLAAYRSDGAVAMMGRAYDPIQGNRISLRLVRPDGPERYTVLDELTLAAPLTRDNFEGVEVVPQADGALRIYLLSDDNASATQHTYLFAFDWNPS